MSERLIDANALTEKIKAEHRNQAEQDPSGMYGLVPLAYADCCGMVQLAPTIEPKRGEWKWTCDDVGMLYEYTCSACQIQIHISKFKLWNFCPNCGADMREETP